MSQKPFSEILEKLGFSRASETDAPAITRLSNMEDRGAFYRGDFLIENTVAVDEEGNAWLYNGHIDLFPHGFRDIAKPVFQ